MFSIMEVYDLTWRDFQSRIAKSFSSLRGEKHFYDVTLVSDDQKQVVAHRVVLASCSEYFKNILARNPQHSLVCLPGVNEQDLKHILDYAYCGEVKVGKENLSKFLNIAKRFALDGFLEKDPVVLANVDSPSTMELGENVDDMYVDFMKAIEVPKNISKSEEDLPEDYIKILYHSFKYDSATKVHYCNSCDFKSNHKDHMKKHVERHHMVMEGMSFPCKTCGKVFPSRPGILDHQRRKGRCNPGRNIETQPTTEQKYKVKFDVK